jgi:transposase
MKYFALACNIDVLERRRDELERWAREEAGCKSLDHIKRVYHDLWDLRDAANEGGGDIRDHVIRRRYLRLAIDIEERVDEVFGVALDAAGWD